MSLCAHCDGSYNAIPADLFPLPQFARGSFYVKNPGDPEIYGCPTLTTHEFALGLLFGGFCYALR